MNTLQFSEVESDYPHPLAPNLREKLPLLRVISNPAHFEAQLEGMEHRIEPSRVNEELRGNLSRNLSALPREVIGSNALVVVGRVIPGELLSRFQEALPGLLQYTGAYHSVNAEDHAKYARAGVSIGAGFLSHLGRGNFEPCSGIDYGFELANFAQPGFHVDFCTTQTELALGRMSEDIKRKETISEADLLREQKRQITPAPGLNMDRCFFGPFEQPAYTEAAVEADVKRFLQAREKRSADLEELLKAL